MENAYTASPNRRIISQGAFDVLGLTFIYFIPALSHLFSFPLYNFEPTRFVLIFALAHTSKRNTAVLAVFMPIFGYFVSYHPVFLKSALICVELSFNLLIFIFLEKKLRNLFFAAGISIICSKIIYYALKALALNAGLLSGDLIATPILIQAVLTLFFSAYMYFIKFKLTDRK